MVILRTIKVTIGLHVGIKGQQAGARVLGGKL